jgi:hypothetical protein
VSAPYVFGWTGKLASSMSVQVTARGGAPAGARSRHSTCCNNLTSCNARQPSGGAAG